MKKKNGLRVPSVVIFLTRRRTIIALSTSPHLTTSIFLESGVRLLTGIFTKYGGGDGENRIIEVYYR